MLYDYIFRMILLGQPGVGKTSLLNKLSRCANTPIYQPTIGLDFASIETHLVNGIVIKSQVWDTAGQEYFAPIVRNYYQNIAAAIFVYDVGDPESLEGVRKWLFELRQVNNEPCKLILVGNKIDIEQRKVTEQEAKEFATKNEMKYYEVSVRKNENVYGFYYECIENIYNSIKEGETLPPGIKTTERVFPRPLTPLGSEDMVQCCKLL